MQLPSHEVLASFAGRTAMLAVREKGEDVMHVRVRVREARIAFGSRLDLLVEPVYGIGQTWVTLAYFDTHHKGFKSRIKLEE